MLVHWAAQACDTRRSRLALAVSSACTLVLLAATVGPWRRCACSGRGVEAADRPGTTESSPANATVAICAMVHLRADDPQWVNGRAEDLHEWLEHHRSVGVGRVYIFDHLSEVPLNDTLHEHIASGLVVYEYFTRPYDGIVGLQELVYNGCLRRFGSRHRYMALIDVDEYFVLMDKRPNAAATLGAQLGEYHSIRPFGGLVVPWVPFGSSGHIMRPKGGTLRNYWRCLPRWSAHSLHVKTIVNTEHAKQAKGPHSWEFNEPYYAIDQGFERFDHVVLPLERGSVGKIALFHYVLKSAEDFQHKSQRGAADGSHKQVDFFDDTDSEAICNCTDLAMPGSPSECSDGTHPYGTVPAR